MIKYAIVIFVLLSMSSCSSIASTWEKVPPDNLRKASNWENVNYCVVETVSKNTLQLLEKKPLEKISLLQANVLCESEKAIEIENGFQPYLVRALFINQFTGTYIVKRLDAHLWINHESLSSLSASPRKSVLIVFLKEPPSEVYVTAYADE